MHYKTRRIRMLVIVAASTLGAALLPGCAFLSRASESPAGVQSNNEAFDPALSSDGRWVAFTSPASNLVPGDTNGISDVFVRDNWTKTVALVSVSTAGDEADTSDQLQDIADKRLAMSDDGRIVAFSTIADNLVPGDDNGLPDVFWHDRDADEDGIFDEPGAIATLLASARPDDSSGTGASEHPALNASGSVLAFDSDAEDLLAAPDHDTNFQPDVFAAHFDLATGQRTGTSIVSRTPGQSVIEANDTSREPSVDASGSRIAFYTFAENLIPGDSNLKADIAVNDGIQIRRGSGPVQPNSGAFSPAISRDGSRVAYMSDATNLVAGDTTRNEELFVTDYAGTGATISASRDAIGGQSGEVGGWTASLSADGTRVAFVTDGALVPGDTNANFDAYVRDVPSGSIQRVSTSALQENGDAHGLAPMLSADGRFVAFASDSLILLPDANGHSYDVFVRVALIPVIDQVRAVDPVTHVEGPAVVHPGANQLRIHGAAFGPGVAVTLGNGTTTSVTKVTPTAVDVTVVVAPSPPAGTRTVVVNNLGTQGAIAAGTLQACGGCVTVSP